MVIIIIAVSSINTQLWATLCI